MYLENTFFGVQLELGGAQAIEGFRQVLQESFLLPGLDHNVIDVHLDIAGLQVLESDAHGPLEGQTSILEPKGHADVAVRSHRACERCLLLVLLRHADLVVPGVRIQKAKEVASRRGVDVLVDAG